MTPEQPAIVRAHSRACAVFSDAWEPPAQLDRSGELAPTIEGGTDRHSLSFGDDEHTLSRVTRATTGKRRSGPTRSTCYGNSCARPAFAVRGARNVLMWLMFGLAVWLIAGALTA